MIKKKRDGAPHKPVMSKRLADALATQVARFTDIMNEGKTCLPCGLCKIDIHMDCLNCPFPLSEGDVVPVGERCMDAVFANMTGNEILDLRTGNPFFQFHSGYDGSTFMGWRANRRARMHIEAIVEFYTSWLKNRVCPDVVFRKTTWHDEGNHEIEVSDACDEENLSDAEETGDQT